MQEPRRRWAQFSLRTLLLVTTLVAVSLGLIETAVGLGIALVATFARSLAVVASMAVAWLCTLVIAGFAALLGEVGRRTRHA
ncbi:MAG TPA: hypothetical protein VMY37_03570 [Thermoguttaceae bacterium]|nr:hypothetical protein [Thermoguttaceae bacterium]